MSKTAIPSELFSNPIIGDVQELAKLLRSATIGILEGQIAGLAHLTLTRALERSPLSEDDRAELERESLGALALVFYGDVSDDQIAHEAQTLRRAQEAIQGGLEQKVDDDIAMFFAEMRMDGRLMDGPAKLDAYRMVLRLRDNVSRFAEIVLRDYEIDWYLVAEPKIIDEYYSTLLDIWARLAEEHEQRLDKS